MAERIPLVYNPDANQLQEVSLTDETNVGILTAIAVSNVNTLTSPVSLANSAFNYLMVGPITIGVGGTLTVGAGVSYVIV